MVGVRLRALNNLSSLAAMLNDNDAESPIGCSNCSLLTNEG